MAAAWAPLGIVLIVAATVAVLVFASIRYWIDARAAERRERGRFALLRKLAEQPAESVQLILERLREEDAKERERTHVKAHRARREGLQGGLVVVAVGIGLSATLVAVEPRVWMVGLIPILVGTVVFMFAFFAESPDHPKSDPSGPDR
jgi:Flp pilus assembly protein TadB